MTSDGRFTEAREIWETEDRMILVMRIVLALSAQLIIFLDPTRPLRTSAVVSGILALYALYSLVLFLAVTRRTRMEKAVSTFAYWLDIAWYAVLVAFSGGVTSIFFTGFLFPILVASFRWGFGPGLRATLASLLSFVLISLTSLAPPGTEPELNRLLLKSTWMLGLGYLAAHWGGVEITLKRRLQLLKEITEFSNPRFGINRTVATLLMRLQDFYEAQSCLMVFNDSDGVGFRMQRTNLLDPDAAAKSEPVAPELARRLLELSPELAAVHNARAEGWLHLGRVYQTLDLALHRVTPVAPRTFAALAATLDANSLVTVPLQFRNENLGRLYVAASRPAFVQSDMRFLCQVLDHVDPILENIRLVEKLASHAADEERHRLARDIHDSVIQPYLGFQVGLAAIREKAGEHFPELAKQIEQLMEVAQNGINDLRRYVTGLKKTGESSGGLMPAIRRFADKFTEATGIAVKIETEGDITASDLLATEAFQMVAEGLSNVRKHTQATRATVHLACRLGHLILEIENEGSPRRASAPVFTPASIAERAAALGGKTRVKQMQHGGSAVVIDIPL